MGYPQRRKYRKQGRSSSGFGGMIRDLAFIANKLSPTGALITGIFGFLTLYFVIPWMLAAWAEHNKATMSSGAVGQAMGKLLDGIFIRRFIHPAEWAGIAVLLVCLGIAVWKAYTQTNLDYESRRNASALAKLFARFLD